MTIHSIHRKLKTGRDSRLQPHGVKVAAVIIDNNNHHTHYDQTQQKQHRVLDILICRTQETRLWDERSASACRLDFALLQWSRFLQQRLGNESMRRFDACALCLQRARDPVACQEGHLFCKECAYTDLRKSRHSSIPPVFRVVRLVQWRKRRT